MSVKGKKHLSKMLALCRTIVESASHLAVYKEDSLLKPDTISGLNTLEVSLESFGAYSSIKITQLLKSCIENEIYQYDKEFEAILLYWYSSVSRTIQALWTSETLLCPICNGTGKASYMAYSYREKPAGSDLMLSGLWLQCGRCHNYYCVKKPRRQPPLPARKPEGMPGSTKYRHMAEAVNRYVRDGFVLFAGDGQADVFPLLSADNYILHSCSNEQLEKMPENNFFYGRYQAVLIENLSDANDIGSILSNAANCLSEGGILWFDMPDFEKCMQLLHSAGTAVSFHSRGDVILSPLGLEMMKGGLGMNIISYRTNDAGVRIEFVAGKE